MTANRSLWELHLAVALFGGTALFAKLIPLGALDMTVLRCLVAALTLALVVKVARGRLRLGSFREYGIALVLGLVVSLHWVTYFASMQVSTVAVGMIAFFTYPVMAVLLEPLLKRQLPSLRDLGAAAVVLAGIVLILPDTDLGNSTTQGVALGVLSALLFTLRNLLHKHQFSHHSGPKAMFYQCLVAVLVLAPFQSDAALAMPAWGWGLVLVLGIGFTATPHALLAQALGNLKVKSVALISCLQPIYASVLAALVLHEIPDWRTLLGGALVVSAAVFETLAARTQKP
ncbi:DMT family transporter [Gallaecimonas xiamenensis]|uniref:Membrane protein n=1 Tax=Gallaecimonas xiamenensis 3-C-1 TaxID=745411 RepID=K2IX65_9GAMM|nr:EamA family transporter [Gallaecimonas xiamenensis]EKE67212.1 membrane protein [Gallaecimonas xiamenensis 3-C-1]